MDVFNSEDYVKKRLTDFYSTLHIGAKLIQTTREPNLTVFLRKIFSSEEFWRLADRIQRLKGKFSDDDELVDILSDMIMNEPRLFLVLMYMFRQIRFNNPELVYLLFDIDRLNDSSYYDMLMENSECFSSKFKKFIKSSSWMKNLDENDTDRLRLATYKKTIYSYLSLDEKNWRCWEERIRNDKDVTVRIAYFSVYHEKLHDIIEYDSVIPILRRNLSIIHVETEKAKRGKIGENLLENLLVKAGFQEINMKVKNLIELENIISGKHNLTSWLGHDVSYSSGKSSYKYIREVRFEKLKKKLDFILLSPSQIKFLVEVNYFTTSMSKVREVVEHFKAMKEKIPDKYGFIYITDGIGWFGQVQTIRKAIELEYELEGNAPDIPFIMNLDQFRRYLPEIKRKMIVV